MREHDVVAETLAKMMGDPLAQPARIDEHKRRSMRTHELDNAVVDLAPHLVRRNHAERLVRHLHRQIEIPAVPRVDDRGWRLGGAALRRVAGTDEKTGDVLDRLDGRRQSDSLGLRSAVLLHKIVETREAQRQVGPPLVVDEGMNLVDDEGLGRGQHPPAALGGEQDEQRLGRRDEDVRRRAHHLLAIPGRCVTRPNRGANRRERPVTRDGQRRDLLQRHFEVSVNVGAERLERRHVDDAQSIGEPGLGRRHDETVETDEERRERLPRSCRGRDQHIPTGLDLRPRRGLRFGRAGESAGEPLGRQRMEAVHRENSASGLLQSTSLRPTHDTGDHESHAT